MLESWTARAGRAAALWLFATALALLTLSSFRTAHAQANPSQGPGGPVLVVTSTAAPTPNFGTFYAEILRAEGLNAFAVADLGTVSEASLATYDVVILARTPLTSVQATTLANWVNGGGKLIAMDPDPELASLLGIVPAGGTLVGGYLRIDTATAVGSSISGETLQFHGTARTFAPAGASTLATLYSGPTTATAFPAVTRRSVGPNGGEAVAFAFDLANSIVYARQGNPAWSQQERDGRSPIRSNDLYYGASATDPQPDWVNLDRLGVPQADEQQRFFAKLLTELSLDRRPLPRFWYFPNQNRAAVVLTGDDHGGSQTALIERFDQLLSLSPTGCSVDNWECHRATAYVSLVPNFQFSFAQSALTGPQAASYTQQGFEVASHINTACADFTASTLNSFISGQLSSFAQKYASVPPPTTNRYHCIVWSDWATGAKVARNYQIRLDTNYYLWPPEWLQNRPGHFTGSAMPMRFADLDGSLIDVYQAVTQMTDESGQSYPFTVDTLLDRALGPDEHYGFFTVNAHTDNVQPPIADSIISSALARGVPLISSRQLLTWLDGRNGSSFGNLSRSGNALTFSISRASGATGLQAMVPYASRFGTLSTITRAGADVPYVVTAVKGVSYAMIPAIAGIYVASYATDTTPPAVVSQTPTAGMTGVSTTTTITASFSKPLDPATITSGTFQLRTSGGATITGSVTYTAGTSTAVFTPSASLAFATTYIATLKGGSTGAVIKDLSGNALTGDFTWSFTTASGPACPCSGWSPATVPALASSSDTNSVELGVRFRPSVSGWITGVRFYKGAANTGTHVGNLWTTGGARLATATFANETATGWQTVTFQSPVQVTAGTTYVASYFAPNGGYSINAGFFTNSGYTNGPLYFLRDGEAGGNGVYAYSGSSTFPTNTFNASNYWVDVVFVASLGGDTVPPTVSSIVPASGAANVPVSSTVTATFSELLDAATVNTETATLRSAGGALVAASVSYDAANARITLAPGAALASNTAYTLTLRGGASDPRIKDLAANALAADVTSTFTTGAADASPPTVTVRSPAADATGVSTDTTVAVTFSEALAASSVTTGSVELRTAGGAVVAAALSYDTANLRVTLTPSASLAGGTTYTAVVRGGTSGPRVTDLAGNALASDVTWAFTTAAGPNCPCFVFPSTVTPTVVADADTAAVELGMKFRPNVSGYLTGVRFWKGSSTMTGTKSVSLWTTGGARLATATIATETATGWQTGTFQTPVAVTANTVYVVSYFAPEGRYSATGSYFTSAGVTNGPLYALRDGESGGNGVYAYTATSSFPSQTYQAANYWVDPVFVTSLIDTTGPTVTSVSPSNGATSIPTSAIIRAIFSESLDPATVGSATFELRDPGTNLVPASVTYDTANRTAVLTPAAALAPGTTYTATVVGGATDPRIKDLAGNALFATSVWVFTTAALDTTRPTVTARNPTSGATNVGLSNVVSVTFSEDMDPASVIASNVQLRDAANSLVAATVTYSAGTRTATLSPSATLLPSTTYTVTVRGGAGGVQDLAANALAGNDTWSFTTVSLSGACAANAITAENCLAGNPRSEWDITGIGDATIQGFATEISVNRGESVQFKVRTDAAAYRFDIYRLGWYGGQGARKVATVTPTAALPQTQPNCLNDPTTGLIDCGNWSVSGSWAVPANATTGVYIARAVRTDTGGASHIVFIVRNDASANALVFQTADTTWQAYNEYGGNSLYVGQPAGRAYKVSYNRPFTTRIVSNGQDWLFNAEYPMIRWLERNGYDLTYITGVDADRRGNLIRNHRAFLSVGHDEYWSGQQRANVEAAREAGVHLAFFSGNEVFWKTRWEPSIDGSSTAYRTLVTYKETLAGAKIDPTPTWTGTWRDPRFSPPSDGGRPENALTGTIFVVNDMPGQAMTVPEQFSRLRFWRNTSIANLAPGQTATLPTGVLGYEWNIDADNGFRPPGLFQLSSTTISGAPVLQDFGSSYAPGTATHALTMYRAPSGALVFGAGTIQWSWGLDDVHDRAGTPADARMQQATVNLFADMGAQPATLQAGLVPATASTDATPPVATITAPAAGASVSQSSGITVQGSASDVGGVVAAVEVSIDSGTTWRRANGTASWSIVVPTPSTIGPLSVLARAIDDTVNFQATPSSVTVNVTGATCPCTGFDAGATPAQVGVSDGQPIQLGVKFRTNVNGFIQAVRFYKASTSTGTHTGNLWTASGQLLGTATFTNDGASGWQTITFANPIAVTANTTYVASYHSPTGVYSLTGNFFTQGVDRGPIRLLSSAESGGNGVFVYGAATSFPTSSWNASNYWVDVVFANGASDTTAPTVASRSPAPGATGVPANTTVTATFSEALDAASISTATVELRTSSGTLVGAAVAYATAGFTVTLTPTAALADLTAYTVTLRGGATGIKDVAGNALATDVTWTFTTAAASDTVAPTVAARSPAPGATGVATTTAVSATFSEALDPASVSSTTVELRSAAGVLVTAGVAYAAAGFTVTLTPTAPLASGVTYTATLRGGPTGLKDVAGNALAADSVWSFTTIPDTTAPTITVRSPTAGATGVSVGTNVTVTFSEAMNAATVSGTTFELRSPAGTLVAAAVSYSATTRVATLNPTVDLAGGITYTATVRGGTAGVQDLAANPLASDSVWSFTTAGDSTAPTITSRSPLAGATGVAIGANVTATFSEAVAAASVTTTTVELRSPAGVLIPAVVSLDASARTVTLNPNANLANNTTYTATVRGGASGVKDLVGNALAADAVWSFTTAPDTTLPTIASRSPATNATGVAVTSTVSARFSEALDPTTVSGTTFELRTTAGVAVPASVTYEPATFTIRLTPSARLANLTGYTATVRGGAAGVKDLAGNALAADSTWSFTTVADTTRPTIAARTPASGATGVARNTAVTLRFSEAMDPASITATTFTLRTTSGSVFVPRSVSYDPVTFTATLTPSATLAASTGYTASVTGGTGGVRDVAGNTLSATSSWSFTTGTL
jgi:hypothetical protein